MKRNRFSEEQIIGILKEHETGVPVADLCRKHGVSNASIYKWKAKYGGMDIGYRRLHVLLRREGHVVNHKRLFRIYREEKLSVRRRGGRK
ncbi:transposase, partial [Nitratireductor aquimarinus]